MPPDEHMLALRHVDQLRTDVANLEAGQEFLMQQINRLPTARDLWRAATLIGLIGAVLGIVGIELLRGILAKFGAIGPVSAELAQKLHRYAPPPAARRPTAEERDPNRAPRQGRRPRR